jgi:translation initiation factor 3 subunit C
VKEMLRRKIREESLRTYLFTYSSVYDSISIPRLAEMYELEFQQVHSVVAKMIINQELAVIKQDFYSFRQLVFVCLY